MRLGLLSFLLVVSLRGGELPVIIRPVPEMEAISLQSCAHLDKKLIPECSALWASFKNPGVFWTLSDSGNKPEIIPIRVEGSIAWGNRGNVLPGVKNNDWEALTGDREGNLIVADVGNNLSNRRQLNLYLFREPTPTKSEVTEIRSISFSWPDQTEFPDPELRHDCEAIFKIKDKTYLLTKHRRDTLTDLWRVDIPATGDRAALVKLSSFDAQGMVTDASISPDGKYLAILTYRAIWVITLPQTGEDIFNGPAVFATLSPPVLSWQIEGCAWLNAQTLLIGSEQGDLFKIPLSALQPVK